MDLIIFARHEDKESHNGKLLAYVRERLSSMGRRFKIIDLYKEDFDPVMPTPTYSDENMDDVVRRYQAMVSESDRLIIISPIWWYNVPAILKGFFDRVFTSGFAFKFGPAGPVPLLADKKAVVINTFAGPWESLEKFGKAPIMAIDKATLGFCGFAVSRVNWFNCTSSSEIPEKVKSEIDSALRG